ncbi:MAG: Fic family protein [Solirubrobacterales bacterium]
MAAMSEPQQLSADDLAKLDSEYRPFPRFADWPREAPYQARWNAARERLTTLGGEVSQADLDRAREVTIRAASFDTGAIERLYSTSRGLTLTVAEQSTAWEQTVRDESGEDALALFQAQRNAFDLVLDLVTNHYPKVTQAWIRSLHRELTSAQDTYIVQTPAGPQRQNLPRGEYKTHANHVLTEEGTTHSYAPVEQTHSEMTRLMEELESDVFLQADPVLQASYAHYALVVVHPFADGNGRVARALASVYTYRAASIPLLILADMVDRYLRALGEADRGDPSNYVALVSQATHSAMEMVSESLLASKAPQPDEVLKKFKELQIAQSDLTHGQLDEIGTEVAERFTAILVDRIDALSIPNGMSATAELGRIPSRRQQDQPSGFRSIEASDGACNVDLVVRTGPPTQVEVEHRFKVFVSDRTDPLATVKIWGGNEPADSLTLSFDDVRSGLAMAAEQRLTAYAERFLGTVLNQALSEAKARLDDAPY